MKNLFSLIILVFVLIFCEPSNGDLECKDKFVKMTTSTLNILEDKPKDLATYLCNKLLGYGVVKSPKNKEAEHRNKEWQSCYDDHLQYFEKVRVSKATIEKYAEFCNRYTTQNSCHYPINSYKLMSRLKPYCWNLEDIAKADENIFSENIKITPEDWKIVFNMNKVNIRTCLNEISSDVIDEDNPTVENMNLGLLKRYNSFMNMDEQLCTCTELIELDGIYDSCNTNRTYSKVNFYEDVCTKRYKKYSWKKEHLRAIEKYGRTYRGKKSLKISIENIVMFLSLADILAFKGWLSPDIQNSNWSFEYLLKKSLTDKESINHLSVNAMAEAISFNYSMDLFDQLIEITSVFKVNEEDNFDIWRCRKVIMNAFFDNEKQNKPHRLISHNMENLKFSNQILKVFLQSKDPKTICVDFLYSIKGIWDTIHGYWHQLDSDDLLDLFQTAVQKGKYAEDVNKCLSFTSSIAREIVNRKMLKRKPGIDDNAYDNFKKEKLRQFRSKIFKNTENYNLCNADFKTYMSTNPESEKNIEKLFAKLFSAEEMKYFMGALNPKDDQSNIMIPIT